MRGLLAVNFKCPMKPAFFHVKGLPVCNILLVLQSSLLHYPFFSLWRSAKQFQRLHLNQGGLHNHLYMALNLDIAPLSVYNLYCDLAVKYQPAPQQLYNVAFILDSSENLNTASF